MKSQLTSTKTEVFASVHHHSAQMIATSHDLTVLHNPTKKKTTPKHQKTVSPEVGQGSIRLNLAMGCRSHNTALHELLHALGVLT